MFTVGELVVCVDDRFTPTAFEMCLQLPRKGEVYTIRTVIVARCRATGATGLGGQLVELVNPIQSHTWNGEPGFFASRFKPLGVAEHARDEASMCVGATA